MEKLAALIPVIVTLSLFDVCSVVAQNRELYSMSYYVHCPTFIAKNHASKQKLTVH